MKKLIATAAVGLLGLGLTGNVLAAGTVQGVQCKSVEEGKQVQFRHGEYLPGTHLIGKCVQGVHENRLGEVKEIIIDAGRGQIAYLMVAPDPSLGIGEKSRLVPWTALHTDPNTGILTASINADKFKEAPTEVANRKQAKQIHQFYGVAPYWQKRPRRQMQKGEEVEKPIPEPTPLWWE